MSLLNNSLLNDTETAIWTAAFGTAVAKGVGRGPAIEVAYGAVLAFRLKNTSRDRETYDNDALAMFDRLHLRG